GLQSAQQSSRISRPLAQRRIARDRRQRVHARPPSAGGTRHAPHCLRGRRHAPNAAAPEVRSRPPGASRGTEPHHPAESTPIPAIRMRRCDLVYVLLPSGSANDGPPTGLGIHVHPPAATAVDRRKRSKRRRVATRNSSNAKSRGG